jgi:hypothetical protein
MFYCENCNDLVERGQPVNKIIKSYREKIYDNVIRTRKQEKRYGLNKGDIWQTEGREIEKEIDVCPKCCIGLTGRKPKLRQSTEPPREHPKRKKFRRNYKRVEQKQSRRRPEVSIVTKLPIVR